MKILFFANSRMATGVGEEEMLVDDLLSESELWTRLIARHPALAEIRSATRLARNGAYAGQDARYGNEDEVALIPPVSGG